VVGVKVRVRVRAVNREIGEHEVGSGKGEESFVLGLVRVRARFVRLQFGLGLWLCSS
jgi:hypothetical protein